MTRSIFAIFFAVVLVSCAASQDSVNRGLAQVDAYNLSENRKYSLANGQREFPAEKSLVLKAATSALPDLNFALNTVDGDLGILVAEGRGVFSSEKEEALAQPALKRMSDATGLVFSYVPSNYTVRLTLNLFDAPEGSTRAKIGISSTTDGLGAGQGVSHNLAPEIFKAIHLEVWQAIDKALFIQNALE